jgi:hypothetical protein
LFVSTDAMFRSNTCNFGRFRLSFLRQAFVPARKTTIYK